jgi:hypothetical protein
VEKLTPMMTSRLFNSAEVSFHCPTRFSKPSHLDVPESLRIGRREDSAGGVMISDAIQENNTCSTLGADVPMSQSLKLLIP